MLSLKKIEDILGSDIYRKEAKLYTPSSPDRASSGSSVYSIQRVVQEDPEQREDPIVEVITPEVYDGSRNPFSTIWLRSLRIKIIGRNGFEKHDVRIPVSPFQTATTYFV